VSCGIAGLAAPVPCSQMAPTPSGVRVALDGMTVLDGVLYPLPETAHMAMQYGWRWTNPTASERKTAQLRPGEPLERWERQDHWGYLVERGGQWTLTHRGIDGDIETGFDQLASALAEHHAYHAAYEAVIGGPAGDEWTSAARVVSLADIAVALPLARKAVADRKERLLSGALPSPPPPPAIVAPAAEPTLPRYVVPVELPNGTQLSTTETTSPEGSTVIGSIELPAGFAGAVEPITIGVEVTIGSPSAPEAAPLLTAAQVAAIRGDVVAPPGALIQLPGPVTVLDQSGPIKGPVWAIPASPDGQATIPFGYARVIAALTLEAFLGESVRLCWDVDLKTDIEAPPFEGPQGDANVDYFRGKRAHEALTRLRGAVASQADDPGRLADFGVIARNASGHAVIPVDIPEDEVNIARIANGRPPIGKWTFMRESTFMGLAPSRADATFFDPDNIPF
jgi:hypothetical protein